MKTTACGKKLWVVNHLVHIDEDGELYSRSEREPDCMAGSVLSANVLRIIMNTNTMDLFILLYSPISQAR